jgi:hypothetical protein
MALLGSSIRWLQFCNQFRLISIIIGHVKVNSNTSYGLAYYDWSLKSFIRWRDEHRNRGNMIRWTKCAVINLECIHWLLEYIRHYPTYCYIVNIKSLIAFSTKGRKSKHLLRKLNIHPKNTGALHRRSAQTLPPSTPTNFLKHSIPTKETNHSTETTLLQVTKDRLIFNLKRKFYINITGSAQVWYK